jgi:hypothetical protein
VLARCTVSLPARPVSLIRVVPSCMAVRPCS